jgi:thioredoxin-dependent peroxiredoxin
MPISSGKQAPDFTLPDENNTFRRLSDFRGRTVVLYFYPKDDTPGCTTEACNFRDNYSAYINADVVILGVSPDTTQSHGKFKEKFMLPYLLLADKEHKICQKYGVWGPRKFMGRDFEGVLRTTFLIDPNGKILKVFEKVKPSEHSAEVLAEIKALRG